MKISSSPLEFDPTSSLSHWDFTRVRDLSQYLRHFT